MVFRIKPTPARAIATVVIPGFTLLPKARRNTATPQVMPSTKLINFFFLVEGINEHGQGHTKVGHREAKQRVCPTLTKYREKGRHTTEDHDEHHNRSQYAYPTLKALKGGAQRIPFRVSRAV